MHLASNRRKVSFSRPDGLLANMHANQHFELQELADLSDRFRNAHARLNSIELQLHENLGSGDRLSLLRSLEEARMDYSDARFALSTRTIISGR